MYIAFTNGAIARQFVNISTDSFLNVIRQGFGQFNILARNYQWNCIGRIFRCIGRHLQQQKGSGRSCLLLVWLLLLLLLLAQGWCHGGKTRRQAEESDQNKNAHDNRNEWRFEKDE